MKKVFSTIEQVKEYLNEDHKTIRCLICGEKFKQLGAHLKKHNITTRDYKISFGIPVK